MEPNKFRNNVLIDFKMMIDTDMGSALYIRLNSTLKDSLNENIFTASPSYFQYMALTRKEENPIEYMFKPEYKGSADNLYGELVAKKWDEVIETSPITDIYSVMDLGIKEGGYKVTVNCLNEIEAKRAKTLSSRFNTVIEETDVSKYDFIYMHYIADIQRRKWDVDKKVIYLYDWSLNHVKFENVNDNSINPIAMAYMEKTVFNFINPYSNFVMPKG